MRWTGARVETVVAAVLLVLGIAASAVLAFVDDAATGQRLIAVALVALGGLVPVQRQLRRGLALEPWERFVAYGRSRIPTREMRTPWAVFDLVPGDTLSSVRTALGGDEDVVDRVWGPDGIDKDRDLRTWRRKGFAFSVVVQRDVVEEITVRLADTPPGSVRIVLPRGVVLGTTGITELRAAGERPPDESRIFTAENENFLDVEWLTGPEGTLRFELSLSGHADEPTDALLTRAFTRCTLAQAGEAIHAQTRWRGWPLI